MSDTVRPLGDSPVDRGSRWLSRYTRFGPLGLVAGTVLCVVAVFTNPVPDPSFPWFSVPPAYRVPVRQPLVEHWPVSYTVGVWLWVFCAPSVFLHGYARFEERFELGAATWLVGLPAVSMLGLTTYCRFFWPKLQPPTWNAPAYTFVCWLYCSTYDPLWSNLAYLVGAAGLLGSVLLVRRSGVGVALEAAFGVLALPLGFPAIYDAYRRHVT